MAKRSSSVQNLRFLAPFHGKAITPPPIWLMRQAGRYLPEYREIRKQAGSFLDLGDNPALAAEVTLQPIRRYGFDAAILFADILLVPDALGQPLRFAEGEGPLLDPITCEADLSRLQPAATSAQVRERCGNGCPPPAGSAEGNGAHRFLRRTLDCRHLHGRRPRLQGSGSRTPMGLSRSGRLPEAHRHAGRHVHRIPLTPGRGWRRCLADLRYLVGSLPDDELDRWVVEPTKAMVQAIKQRHPDVPIIGFPRGIGSATLWYVAETGVDGIGCDTAMPPYMMSEAFDDEDVVVQGNLDPLLLVAGGEALEERTEEILERMAGKRFVFNLGHGIVPQTPPENVARLVEIVRRNTNSH